LVVEAIDGVDGVTDGFDGDSVNEMVAAGR
jgi:hypothetical protein